MCLREILEIMANKGERVLRSHGKNRDWKAGALQGALSGPMLKKLAYLQPGLYIAEINEAGYLGRVLYRISARAWSPQFSASTPEQTSG